MTPAPSRWPPKPGQVDALHVDALYRAGNLTQKDRKTIVDQAIRVLDQFYAHRDLKRAVHGADPVMRLKALRRRLNETVDSNSAEPASGDMKKRPPAPEVEFHREMTAIFNSLRDRHTLYLLPKPFSEMVAFLPFEVEKYTVDGRSHYVVTRVNSEVFELGMQPVDKTSTYPPQPRWRVEAWNGRPIEAAIERNAAQNPGSNSAARFARGLERLTVRPLAVCTVPDAMWVNVRFRTNCERVRDLRFYQMEGVNLASLASENARVPETVVLEFYWLVKTVKDIKEREETQETQKIHQALGVDVELDTSNWFRRSCKGDYESGSRHSPSGTHAIDERGPLAKLRNRNLELFSDLRRKARSKGGKHQQTVCGQGASGGATRPIQDQPNEDRIEVPKEVFDYLTARSVRVVLSAKAKARVFGYIRIFSFNVDDDTTFMKGFRDLLTDERMPQDGLILDVRSNGGGVIRAGDRILQLLTPRRIEPSPFQMIMSPLTLMLSREEHFRKWAAAASLAARTGMTYSPGVPISSAGECNEIGQVYYGPIVLITDANCYSTTDMFIAGFKDHQIGPVIGTDRNTGAGGANVWAYSRLSRALEHLEHDTLRPLPGGVDFNIAVRRSLRVGANAGMPLEDLGVEPDYLYSYSENDLFAKNEDLIEQAAVFLVERSPQETKNRLVKLEPKAPPTWPMPVARRLDWQEPPPLMRRTSNWSFEAARRPGGGSVLKLEDEQIRFTLSTHNIERLDVSVDGRPEETRDIEQNKGDRAVTTEFKLPRRSTPWPRSKEPGECGLLEIKGYARNEEAGWGHVATKRVEIVPG